MNQSQFYRGWGCSSPKVEEKHPPLFIHLGLINMGSTCLGEGGFNTLDIFKLGPAFEPTEVRTDGSMLKLCPKPQGTMFKQPDHGHFLAVPLVRGGKENP